MQKQGLDYGINKSSTFNEIWSNPAKRTFDNENITTRRRAFSEYALTNPVEGFAEGYESYYDIAEGETQLLFVQYYEELKNWIIQPMDSKDFAKIFPESYPYYKELIELPLHYRGVK